MFKIKVQYTLDKMKWDHVTSLVDYKRIMENLNEHRALFQCTMGTFKLSDGTIPSLKMCRNILNKYEYLYNNHRDTPTQRMFKIEYIGNV